MNILVAIDFSDATDMILQEVKQLGRAMQAKIWLLHVAEPNPDFVGYEVDPIMMREVVAQRFHKEHQDIQSLSLGLREAGFDTTALLVQGPTVETILHEVAKLKVNMLVVGSHGHGAVYHALMGSVSSGLIKKATCPILVVPVVRQT